jgi:SecD/SecF fusion protein
MEKQKRWQFWLIVTVVVLTLYNILPTIFYYSKPLKSPIDAPRAENISKEIVDRVDSLEEQSKEWLLAFNQLIGVKAQSIELKKDDPRLFVMTFNNAEDAQTFRKFLPTAGILIPFVPSQLQLLPEIGQAQDNVVYVSRNIGVHLDPNDLSKLFTFSPMFVDNKVSPGYLDITADRAVEIASALAGPSPAARQVVSIVDAPASTNNVDQAVALARDIIDAQKTLSKNPEIVKRYYATFTQVDHPDRDNLISKLVTRFETLKTRLDDQHKALAAEDKAQKVNSSKSETMALLDKQALTLETASSVLKKNLADFKAGKKPLSRADLKTLFDKSAKAMDPKENVQTLELAGFDPFIKNIAIHWNDGQLYFGLYSDVQKIRLNPAPNENQALAQEKINQMIVNELARIGHSSDETIQPIGDDYGITLNKLTNAQSFLALNLGYLADKETSQVKNQLNLAWQPKHVDLTRANYPISSYQDYKNEKPEAQKLGLVVYAPAANPNVQPPEGFRKNSIYVIARGLDDILQKYREIPNNQEAKSLVDDFNALQAVLQQSGFIGYSGSSFGLASEFHKDFIFEYSDYYGDLLKATREDFYVKGSKRYAILDFTDVEQRILTRNKIDDSIHEDLLKWKEAYGAAQVDLNPVARYRVPAPTKNVYVDNFELSAIKYFRGDDRKILKWGLDLSGGKTVRIGLRDQNNRPVTNPDDIKQAVNELYVRINAMGVSERTIRIENDNIILDFPGSQGLSASELVKASAMYFNIVNEKFSNSNTEIGQAINRFLQDVWNEAIVTNRKDVDSINEIAWQHLGGEGNDVRPRSEVASFLYQNGLRLANPKTDTTSSAFNDTLSKVAMYRGDDVTEWHRQTHPLVVVFNNYALEGSNLDNVHVGYDPSEGNTLMFSVKRSGLGRDRSTISPQDEFYTWTSQFAADKVAGTPLEAYTQGRGGYRMAVILNGKIVSDPVLRASLRDAGTISGHFTQREINQLAADLKAGSLSFTPKILSEQNVSPELGKEERNKGIFSAALAIILVVSAMIGYYHFAGIVASVAVLFNILIMWGVFQNIDYVMTLPGLAGLVLTVGMAVDANVLVFERIREEFAHSGRIASAIQAGYRKAFSAIFDSNITTIMAAFILIQFDSGPIKGFAVALIIGIISSMFTSLFMTRYYFAGWVKNPKHKSLSMSKFFNTTHFNFLAQTKKAVIISIIVMLLGSYLLVEQRNTILGMDFTGGYSLTVDFDEKPGTNYRQEAMNAILAAGASSNEVQIRELSRPNQLRMQLGISMEEKGHPFYQMPEKTQAPANSNFTYQYQENPRITWLVDTLAKNGLKIQKNELPELERDWTVMSGQLSDTMRNNAIIALFLALVGVLIYITFRFEFKYAIGAVVGLVHDVIITLGIAAMFHKLGFPVSIDLQVVGAIMTIIGYSLNDTIIVFDRIREDIKIYRKMKFADLINQSLNVTLSRTVMTAGTTLLVLLTLVLFGGQSIFGFSLVMLIGIFVGTFSSLFIAAPVMLYFHNREVAQENGGAEVART